jgi:hypothetical protein
MRVTPMFHVLMKPIFEFLLRNGGGWWGKLAACTMIGGLLFGVGALVEGEKAIAIHWGNWAELGAGLGFMSGLILIARDLRLGVNTEDGSRTRAGAASLWATLLFVVAIIGALTVIVVGILMFDSVMKKHAG